MDAGSRLAHAREVGQKTTVVMQRRMHQARDAYQKRISEAVGQDAPALAFAAAMDPFGAVAYATDAMQRGILFWDALRQRGTNFVESAVTGLKPVLHFNYEMVLDAREFPRPVNYALLRIVPPEGVTVDDKRRPYIVIDPRAGHGPGIGGFKDDSQVGVALRAGHPVYFVVFFREPEPGQTMLDVCVAEQVFVKTVRGLHPEARKPAIIGNCQGGWAAMMVAASDPESTGPIVINGAPMTYWSGAWQPGEGDNPMRYAGGLLGGTWLASLAADLGNGKFDGAHLVQNFENLNPANSLWDKYYHLYDQADTEPPRFLDFERWWGGYYLMNREEIEWITQNLFVGNRLWSGDVRGAQGKAFDLRGIKVPIVLFASMGDNITPPQQAFNWVGDIYGSTAEIKANGQVIVGLLHESIGHLGIFVSGKVAKKEHSQIVSVLQSIELLPPGLYGMRIEEMKGEQGAEPEYEVTFHEVELEQVVKRINRFDRQDEQPFHAVAALSDFNQRAYELFLQPFVQATATEYGARLLREFHPLRMQNWALSNMNPWMSWLAPAAAAVRENRQPVDPDNALRKTEKAAAEAVSAGLDYYRATRDAATESLFFNIYANLFSLYQPASSMREQPPQTEDADTAVRDAMAAIEAGGYPEAFARISALLSERGKPLPLGRLEVRKEMARDYADFLPSVPLDHWRPIRGLQEVIVRSDPQRALESLPVLLSEPQDRDRMLSLLEKLVADPRAVGGAPSAGQVAMVGRIRELLRAPSGASNGEADVASDGAAGEAPSGAPAGGAARGRRTAATPRHN
ncbi:DUF3141 domain-containing protein [Paracidovorax citrulli]